MILAELNQIDLDRPINYYLPVGITSRAGDVALATVRRVADHTAGLPLHYQFFYEDEPYSPPPRADTIRRYAKTFAQPGVRYQYSNLGYGLLDHLIEHVSERPFAEFVAEEVFGPLAMNDSSIGPTNASAIPYGESFAYPHYDFDHPGGSAAFASVMDLLRFGQFHLGFLDGPLSPGARKEMQSPSAKVDETSSYGLGWSIAERLGRKVIQHTGSMGGVRTVLRLIPELQAVIAILTNCENDFPYTMVADAQAAVDEVSREQLELSRKLPPPAVQDGPFPAHLKGFFSGFIETPDGELPFAVDLVSGSAVLNGADVPISGLKMHTGNVRGVFDGNVQCEDANRRPYRLHLDLASTETGLQGAIVAITQDSKNSRTGNALSYWCDLAAGSA